MISITPQETKTGHDDNDAVDRFAEKMKAKLKWEREERNRSGWQDMNSDELTRLLFEHLPKGDPVDVANFCMMLALNGQRIASPRETEGREITETAKVVDAFLNMVIVSGMSITEGHNGNHTQYSPLAIEAQRIQSILSATLNTKKD